MELDNKPQVERFSVNVHGGNVQINPDSQNSTIIQNNYPSSFNVNELLLLIDAVKKAMPSTLSANEVVTIQDSLAVIETETASPSPKKSLLRNAMTALKAVKETAEFGAAVVALVQFVHTLIVK